MHHQVHFMHPHSPKHTHAKFCIKAARRNCRTITLQIRIYSHVVGKLFPKIRIRTFLFSCFSVILVENYNIKSLHFQQYFCFISSVSISSLIFTFVFQILKIIGHKCWNFFFFNFEKINWNILNFKLYFFFQVPYFSHWKEGLSYEYNLTTLSQV